MTEIENCFVCIKKSEETGIITVLARKKSDYQMRINGVVCNVLLMMCSFFVVVVLSVYYFTKYLTTSIEQLEKEVNRRNIENLEEPIEVCTDIVEIDSLGKSFNLLMKRLSDAVSKERIAYQLRMQAQFDAFQSGVNPHFIYNVLNLIANRGVMLDDFEISRVCSKLGSILRYSTNTKERMAEIGEELAYLEDYFYLIKARYPENFSYRIERESEEILRIPKLGLQQIVENSIKHGFDVSSLDMSMKITIRKIGTEWQLEVADNGSGFDSGIPEKLQNEMEHAKTNLSEQVDGFQIGGMGMVNTFLRYYLIYGDAVHFEMGNTEQGAYVRIRIEEGATEQNV